MHSTDKLRIDGLIFTRFTFTDCLARFWVSSYCNKSSKRFKSSKSNCWKWRLYQYN